MRLIFLDSSGNTGRDLSQAAVSVYYLMALAVPGDQARALEDQMGQVLTRAFGAACREPRFECKGSDLYRGEGPCSRMGPADRIALYGELLGLLHAHGVRLVWQGIDKARLAARYREPMHPHTLAFVYLVEEVERFLRRESDFGLLVSDEEKDVEEQVVANVSRYKEFGTSFGYKALDLTRIVDNVHFVKSHHSRLLQLCDCCAYLCQRQARDRGKDSRTAEAVRKLWDSLAPRIWNGRVWP